MLNELTVKKNIAWIPDIGIDDQGKMIPLSEAITTTGLDRTTLRPIADSHGGRLYVRIRNLTKKIEKYRYGKLGTCTGAWWTLPELRELFSEKTNAELSAILHRSPGSIKVIRSKLGLSCEDSNIRYPLFVTPHAVNRYRQRIIDVPAKYAIWNIQDGVKNGIMTEISRDNGSTWLCSGRHQLLGFRAVIVTGEGREWPVVATILAKVKE